MKFIKTLGIAAAVTVSMAAGAAHAVPVFTNGDMESSIGTALTGWTTGGAPQEGIARYAGAYPGNGSKWAWLGNYEQLGGWIEQSLSGFSIGASYTLSFLQASEYFNSETTTVTIIGGGTLSNTFTTAPRIGNGLWNNWLAQSWTFTAAASSLTIRIAGAQQVPHDTGIDDVALAQVSAVPVPAALPLLLAALGGLGFVARRRKAA